MKHKAKVVFYLNNDNQTYILLGKRSSGGETFWWIPGGSVEGNEDPLEGLLRELQEEIIPGPSIQNVLSEIIKPGSVPDFFEYTGNNHLYSVFFIKVPAAALNESIEITEEFDAINWFPVNRLPENMSKEFVHIQSKVTVL